MTHSDDDGLVLPPRIAPSHVVIIPVTPKEETRQQVIDYCLELKQKLQDQNYMDGPVRVEFDDSDIRGGEKVWGWIKKGIPLRVEVGPRDIEAGTVFVGRRDREAKDKQSMPDQFVSGIANLLDEMQAGLLAKAKAFQKEHTREITTEANFVEFFTPKNVDAPEIHGGFASMGFCCDSELEDKIAKEYKVTVRCVPNADCRRSGTLCLHWPARQTRDLCQELLKGMRGTPFGCSVFGRQYISRGCRLFN